MKEAICEAGNKVQSVYVGVWQGCKTVREVPSTRKLESLTAFNTTSKQAEMT